MKQLLAAMLLVTVVGVVGCGDTKTPAKKAEPAKAAEPAKPAETPKAP